MAHTMNIGKIFKTSVLGYEPDQRFAGGGLQSDVTFESHKDSEKKGQSGSGCISSIRLT